MTEVERIAWIVEESVMADKTSVDIVRAILTAIREPSDAVIEAGRSCFRKNGLLPAYTDGGGPGQPSIMEFMLRAAWPEMIDAYLDEPTE